LYGANIGPTELANYQLQADGRIGTQVAGTRVLFDNVAAPILYASSGQTAVIVPYAVHTRTLTSIVVERNGVRSAPLNVTAMPAVPALFTANASGRGPGAILNSDNSLNTAANPAAVGSVIVLYGTGEGQTTPGGIDGRPAPAVFQELPRPMLPVSVTIGGVPAEVVYAGAVPYVTAGEFQANVVVPPGLEPGDHEVVVKIGTHSSQPGVTVAVTR
jgi:uncharacterized protein (TIGR03437 family)